MLKLKGLDSMGTVTFGNAGGVTLESIEAAIADLAAQNQIPLAFYTDEAKEGGLFATAVPVLIAYHPEHRRDYFNMAMILSKQGTFGSVAIYAAGKSKQMNRFYRSDISKGALASALNGGGSYAVGQVIGGFLGSLGKNKTKLQEEQLYYEIVLGLINAALGE